MSRCEVSPILVSFDDVPVIVEAGGCRLARQVAAQNVTFRNRTSFPFTLIIKAHDSWLSGRFVGYGALAALSPLGSIDLEISLNGASFGPYKTGPIPGSLLVSTDDGDETWTVQVEMGLLNEPVNESGRVSGTPRASPPVVNAPRSTSAHVIAGSAANIGTGKSVQSPNTQAQMQRKSARFAPYVAACAASLITIGCVALYNHSVHGSDTRPAQTNSTVPALTVLPAPGSAAQLPINPAATPAHTAIVHATTGHTPTGHAPAVHAPTHAPVQTGKHTPANKAAASHNNLEHEKTATAPENRRKSTSSTPDAVGDRRYAQLSTSEVSKDWVRGLSDQDLRYAINELCAWHGITFKNPDVARTFSSKAWYRPKSDRTFSNIANYMTDRERVNFNLLAKVRNSRKPGN